MCIRDSCTGELTPAPPGSLWQLERTVFMIAASLHGAITTCQAPLEWSPSIFVKAYRVYVAIPIPPIFMDEETEAQRMT